MHLYKSWGKQMETGSEKVMIPSNILDQIPWLDIRNEAKKLALEKYKMYHK